MRCQKCHKEFKSEDINIVNIQDYQTAIGHGNKLSIVLCPRCTYKLQDWLYNVSE